MVDLEDLALLPNTPGQSFDLFVQNSSAAFPVTGIGFNLQVADGGPEAPGGLIDAPSITSVDIFSGTPFEQNNNGTSGDGSIRPQVYALGTLTDVGTVDIPPNRSKLATVVFDTTGFSSGTFTYTMNTWNGPLKYTTENGDFFPALADGTLTVVPEPPEYAAAFGIVCLAWAAISRKRRKRDC